MPPRTRVLSISFSHKTGVPLGLDAYFDLRRTVHSDAWKVPGYRQLDGREPSVAGHIFPDTSEQMGDGDGTNMKIFRDAKAHVLDVVNRNVKGCVRVGFGCKNGRHRSVAFAERLATALKSDGMQSDAHHLDLGDNKNDDN